MSSGTKPSVVARFEPMTAAGSEIIGTALAAIDPWARYGYKPAALVSYLATRESDAPRFEIHVDRAIAGAVCIRRNWLRGPYLQLLGILPAFQKQGLGGQTLAWFENEARATRAQNLWVLASEFNVGALAFYQRSGFERVTALQDLVAPGTAEIMFRKRLAYD